MTLLSKEKFPRNVLPMLQGSLGQEQIDQVVRVPLLKKQNGEAPPGDIGGAGAAVMEKSDALVAKLSLYGVREKKIEEQKSRALLFVCFASVLACKKRSVLAFSG